ncbi:alpha-amylase family glycosyl hydrolase [Inhella gelatinilytica]|uniref:Cyclomaltodextrinase N-terminal domain-containing protein n=1 Tax=Inhella gelatinilytica TaxID=2795030 RepID=A0A931IXE5_9BURK|nr:alpha-amylase family glycosyl hydrolase [Inhella gelatinilytica]MBH9553662.1 cyclomaltodextrinase N-terminal domain-containing protein [Inhella gelatinilytica]
MHPRSLPLTLLIGLLSLAAPAAPRIDHLEPPHWWVGMKEPLLQLLVEGPDLRRARVRLEQAPKGVGLRNVDYPGGADAVAINLHIAPQAQPGTVTLRLTDPQGNSVLQRFEIKPRAPGSAQRQGFGPRDAIYLVVPDRFAQDAPTKALPPHLVEPIGSRLNPGDRHGGDLTGLRQALPYIAGLGFTQLWPTPLVENNAARYSYHGYGASDFYRIDPRFGAHTDYLALSQEARQRGVGLIQDIVLNHISTSHRWMQNPPSSDWVNQWPSYTETHHARMSLQDPHAAPSDRQRFASGWFSPNMPDLNQRNPFVATYLTQMSIWWVEEAGLSGIRTDTYSYSDRDFLARWSARLMAEYPKLNIVGEEWSPHPAVVAYWQRGKRNHDGYVSHPPSMMDFPLHGALLASLSESDGHDSGFTKLYEALAHDFVYPAPEQLVLFEGNHDTPRVFSLLKEDATAVRMALSFMATAPRIPQFFYGDEVLFTSPAQRDDGRVRAPMPGGWAGDAANAFSAAGLSPDQRAMQDFVRRLFNWRKAEPLIHTGRTMQYAPRDGVYVLFRYQPGESRRVMLVLNKNAGETRLPLTHFPEMTPGVRTVRDALGGPSPTLQDGVLRLPGRGAYVLELR